MPQYHVLPVHTTASVSTHLLLSPLKYESVEVLYSSLGFKASQEQCAVGGTQEA